VIEQIDTLVLPLGPYRNLTTFTAAMFALHPEGLVLNHADQRIRLLPWVDILAHPTPGRMRRFVDTACVMTQNGRRGDFGGNVLLAHAFDDAGVRTAYEDRFNKNILKKKTHVLFWKDSMKIRNRMDSHGTQPEHLIEAGKACDIRVVFLMPIRHPIDCAWSNLRTGHYRYITNSTDFETVLQRIIEEILYFKYIREVHPAHTYWFSEDGIEDTTLVDFCKNLGMSQDRRWIDAIEKHLKVRPRKRSKADLATYEDVIDRVCSNNRELTHMLRSLK